MFLAACSIIPWLLIVLKVKQMRYVAITPLAYSVFVIAFNVAVLWGSIDATTLNLLSNIIRIFGIISSLTIATFLWKQTQLQ